MGTEPRNVFLREFKSRKMISTDVGQLPAGGIAVDIGALAFHPQVRVCNEK